MAEITQITDAQFDEAVMQSELPVLVDFWAEWCGPCKMMHPILEQLADLAAGQLTIVGLDTQENQATAINYGVMNLPTMILFHQGEEKLRQAGYIPLEKLIEKLNAATA